MGGDRVRDLDWVSSMKSRLLGTEMGGLSPGASMEDLCAVFCERGWRGCLQGKAYL